MRFLPDLIVFKVGVEIKIMKFRVGTLEAVVILVGKQNISA